MPECGWDDEGAGVILAYGCSPGGVVRFSVHAHFQLAVEGDPEVRLVLVAMPGFNDGGVHGGVVYLACVGEYALQLVHEGPAAVVVEMGGGDEEGCILG